MTGQNTHTVWQCKQMGPDWGTPSYLATNQPPDSQPDPTASCDKEGGRGQMAPSPQQTSFLPHKELVQRSSEATLMNPN